MKRLTTFRAFTFTVVFLASSTLFCMLILHFKGLEEDVIRRKSVIQPMNVETNKCTITAADLDNFMSKYRIIHELRANHTMQMCKKYEADIPKMTHLPHLLVDEKYKLVYCQIPKAASTTWSRVFLYLKGYVDYPHALALSRRSVNTAWKSKIPQLHKYSPEKQKEILETYTKFMFVRHPFSRLLSAFNDKLKASKNKTTAMQNQVGKRIIHKFRLKSNISETYDIRFEEFFEFVISEMRATDNAHWRAAHRLCFPCEIHYDIIGKLEDVDNDAKYILKKSGAGHVHFPGTSGSYFTNSSHLDKLRKHLSRVSPPHIAAFYNKYRFDFTLFDYEIPTI
ncbi:carbohydrate sulfotransferase 11-like [Antedon mediterranea]|uniref:carbohydrate sulfotransferase 11-like n=1 Tax=Antedon mediterranea TaxID=105859 RepID=UPI003AF62263